MRHTLCAFLILFLFSAIMFAEEGYRGRRYHGEHHEERFYIEEIDIGERDIVIYFNQPVNPSFDPAKDIIICDRHLPPNTAIKYNKKGTQLTIRLPEGQRRLRPEDIEIYGILSYCGIKLEDYRFTKTRHTCNDCYTERQ